MGSLDRRSTSCVRTRDLQEMYNPHFMHSITGLTQFNDAVGWRMSVILDYLHEFIVSCCGGSFICMQCVVYCVACYGASETTQPNNCNPC